MKQGALSRETQLAIDISDPVPTGAGKPRLRPLPARHRGEQVAAARRSPVLEEAGRRRSTNHTGGNLGKVDEHPPRRQSARTRASEVRDVGHKVRESSSEAKAAPGTDSALNRARDDDGRIARNIKARAITAVDGGATLKGPPEPRGRGNGSADRSFNPGPAGLPIAKHDLDGTLHRPGQGAGGQPALPPSLGKRLDGENVRGEGGVNGAARSIDSE